MSSQNFVIVGGSKGMGLAITRQLSGGGNQVYVLSRTNEELSGIENVTHVQWDAACEEFPVSSLPDEVHGLAYCPGSLVLRSFKNLKPKVFRDDFEINVIGAVKTIQAAMPNLKSTGNASILLFSTVAVQQGMGAHASVAVSKGAIEGLTRTLAAELSPDVRVNCIAPALTDTALTERYFSSPEKVQALGEKYPLGRTGTVNDMAAMSCLLLTNKGSWITGQVIGVDGGMSVVRK